MKVSSIDTPWYWPTSYSLISKSKKIWPIPTALPLPQYLQIISAKMKIMKIHRQTVLSVSAWFLHLPADSLFYCLGHWLDLSSTLCPLWWWHNKRQGKLWQRTKPVWFVAHWIARRQMAITYHLYSKPPIFRCVFHCERIQHLLFKLKTVSVHIWHRSNFSSLDCSEIRKIPNVQNMHLWEELHMPPWNINSLVHLQKEKTITA